MALDFLCARRVVVALGVVLGAVEFDDELALEAEEIDGVAEQRDLPAEFEAIEAVGADQRPEDVLRLGGLPAEFSGEVLSLGGHGASLVNGPTPLPCPSPYRRGVPRASSSSAEGPSSYPHRPQRP